MWSLRKQLNPYGNFRHHVLVLVFTAMVWNPFPLYGAGIDGDALLVEGCLIHHSVLGHDFESLLSQAIQKRLKTKVGQVYRFIDRNTVEIREGEGEGSPGRFAYKISGKKQNRIRISGWTSLAVTSLSNRKMVARALGSVIHRFTRGPCG